MAVAGFEPATSGLTLLELNRVEFDEIERRN